MYETHHFQQRLAQRHIPADATRIAMLFGKRFAQEGGRVLYLVTQKAARRIARELGVPEGEAFNRFHRVFVIASRAGGLITTGRFYKERHVVRH